MRLVNKNTPSKILERHFKMLKMLKKCPYFRKIFEDFSASKIPDPYPRDRGYFKDFSLAIFGDLKTQIIILVKIKNLHPWDWGSPKNPIPKPPLCY